MSRSHHQSRANLDDDNAFVDLDRSVAARAAAQKFLSEGGGGNMMTSQLFMGNETGGVGGGGGSGNKPAPRIALNRSLKAHHKLFVTASSERDKRIQSHLEDMAELYADPTDTTTTSTSKKKAASTTAGKKRERAAVVASDEDEDNGKDSANDNTAMLVHSLAQCGPATLTTTPLTQLNKKALNGHDDDTVLEERISDNLLRFLDGDILLPPYSPPTTSTTNTEEGMVVASSSSSVVSTIPTSLVGIPLTCSYYSMAAPTLDCIEVPAGPHHPSLAVGCGGGSGTVLGGLRQSVAIDCSGASSSDGNKKKSSSSADDDSNVVVSAQFLNRPYVAATTGPGMSATISRPNSSSTSSTPPLLCSVCWLPAPNLCAKCGVARFCCVECADVHDATRCNKFVV